MTFSLNKFQKIGLVLPAIILGLYLMVNQSRPPIVDDQKTIVTSFYPLYFFTQQIVGDNFKVINLIPAGVEPHDYEPSTGDIVTLQNSKAVIINGQGFEHWADQLKSQLQANHIPVVSMADAVSDPLKLNQADVGGIDPHFWLDPVLAMQQVDAITQTIISLDQNNQLYYQAKSEYLKQKLSQLDQDFQTLSKCPTKQIITSHDALGYLAHRYGFEQISIVGSSPQAEPSPKQIAQVADFARQNNIKYIFFETLVSSSLADTIAQEVGAQTLVFNPIEGLTINEATSGVDYFKIQSQNLKNLKIALNCP